MGVGHLLSLYNSIRPTRTKRLTSACLHPIRRYGEGHHHHHGGVEEKAATLAEEFERVSEEKANLHRDEDTQGVATTQTPDKTHQDGGAPAEEAVSGDDDSVKQKYKEPLGKGN